MAITDLAAGTTPRSSKSSCAVLDITTNENCCAFVKSFSAITTSFKVLICASPDGSSPESLLSNTLKTSKFFKYIIDPGNCPVKKLLLKCSCFKFSRFPIDAGISPCNMFPLKANSSNFFKFPRDSGNAPDNLLKESSRTLRLVNIPIDSGRVPVTLLNKRLIPVTVLFSTVTPSQQY